MNDIPLVKDNGINAINTSLIAAKKSLQLIYGILDNVNKTFKDINKEIDAIDAKFADYLLKDDVVNSITDGDMRPVTSNAVAQIAPVDTVASGNLHSVTSNAVFNKLNGIGAVVNLSFPYTTFTAGTHYGQLNCNELLNEGVWLCTGYLLCGSMWFQGDINCTKDNVLCSTYARVLSQNDCRQEITFVVNIPKNMTSRLGFYLQNSNTGIISSDVGYWGITCVKLANV